ncbi:MAG: NADH-quinone oxidoreductase subunit NuoH [Candidatus Marinimicrobia bacterium]|jgi:NADH-quinone oxidoreductase subunit H|nr:NADH-quinone oxidoreductase subunit NuoH [Candidatus Neomarinimicrobiota bacterium]MDP6789071.1 NADH-quinone oxidoreductase subunit NuoH [Candidatus Neomarinimicrobiota bacterium]
MIVDYLIDIIPFAADWPGLVFVSVVIFCAVPVFLFIAVYALVAIYGELKVSSFMQDKIGPMGQGVGLHAGKWGLLQPIADALKLILKEDIIPTTADRKLFILAPFIVFIGAFISMAALPFSQTIIVADMNIGIFYILAVSSLGVIGIILAGWSSNNKWSLYGAMRSAAQIVSYEIPAGLSIIGVVMITGTLSMQGIIEHQSGFVWGILPNWIIFQNPFTFLSFFLFFISGVAECNRTPFDIPEAESELVAGAFTEYSGMRYAFFFLSEYANMFVVSGVAAAAFLGGWRSPIPGVLDTPGWGIMWFIGKSMFLIFMMMWFRWTWPRLRVDQLMSVCWKGFIPIAFFNIFGIGIWKLLIG